MRNWIRAMMVVLSLSTVALSQNTDAQAKAGQLLKQARAAIGDEAKLKALSGLSVSVAARRMAGEIHVESEIEYDILLPDKFRRRDSRQPFTTVTIMDDDKTSTYRLPTPTGGPEPPVNNTPQAQARRKADFARVMLGWLLLTPAFEAVQYSYAGEAKVPDGTADMIDVKGQDGFTARLFLDQQTHRMLMLTWRAKPVVQVMKQLGRIPGRPPRAPQIDRKLTPEQQDKQRQEQQAEQEQRRTEFQEALAKAPEVEYRWVFSEYKNVKGLNLPHHLSKFEAGIEYEEWEISNFRINPRLTAAMFEVKEKQ